MLSFASSSIKTKILKLEAQKKLQNELINKLVEKKLDAHMFKLHVFFANALKLRNALKKGGDLILCTCFEYLSNDTTLYLKFGIK